MKKAEEIWPAVMREDGRRMELICPHGVGHPSQVLSRHWDDSWMGVHGCDGCCSLAAYALSEMARKEDGMSPLDPLAHACAGCATPCDCILTDGECQLCINCLADPVETDQGAG